MVRELDQHLHVRVRAALETLDQALAVALVGLHAQLVRPDLGREVVPGGLDVGADGAGDVEAEPGGFGQVAADRGVVEVELVVVDEGADVVVEAVRRRAVHHAVLAHEARGAVVVDDELTGFVEPAVGAGAVPVDVCALFEGDGRFGVEADEKVGGFDGLEGLGV